MRRITLLLFLISGCTQSWFGDGGLSTIDDDGPVPCETADEGSLGCDFQRVQGGKSGRWRYVDDLKNRTWMEMASGEAKDVVGMVSMMPGDHAVLGSCFDNTSHPLCGNPERVLFIGGDADAAVEFTVPETRQYTLTGTALSEAGQTLRIYRNTREDLIGHITLEPHVEATLDLTLDATANDRFLFAVGPAEPVAIAAQFSPTDGQCALALRFDAITTKEVEDDCQGLIWEGKYLDEMTSGDIVPTTIASVIPELGSAIQFSAGDYLGYPAAPALLYNSSFTIQWWMSFPGDVFPTFESAAYSDAANSGVLGVTAFVEPDGSLVVRFGGQYPFATEFPTGIPMDADWHHIRLVRNIADESFKICIDGVQAAQPFSSAGNETPNKLPWIGGRYHTLEPPYFNGAMDDVRVVYRALPCE
jgi:hypothetical protein